MNIARVPLGGSVASPVGSGDVGRVPATRDTVRWGRLFTGDTAPVVEVASGSVVEIDTISHEGALEDQGRDPEAFFARYGIEHVLPDLVECAAGLAHDPTLDGPHFVTGPIAVEGAKPGDLLRIDILDLQPRTTYGVISDRHAKDVFAPEPHLHPAERADVFWEVVPVVSPSGRDLAVMPDFPAVALAPFLGIMGVAPAGSEAVHSGPPGSYGGNIDLKHLQVGTSLLLPVQAPGANFYVGDPHFVQGNGEVASTALEAPLTARLRLTVVPGAAADNAVDTPIALADDRLMVCGLDRDLGRAVRLATAQTIRLLQRCGKDGDRALLWLSIAGDLEVTQVVDGVLGSHLSAPREPFEPLLAAWFTDGRC